MRIGRGIREFLAFRGGFDPCFAGKTCDVHFWHLRCDGPVIIEVLDATFLPLLGQPEQLVDIAPRTPSNTRFSRSNLVVLPWCPSVSLSEVDRILLQQCLDRVPQAWNHFTDRFLGLVVHVAGHTAKTRGIELDTPTRDDLVADVFLAFVANDFAVLRRFRRNCSLATYLTVIARRVVVRRLLQRFPPTTPPSNEIASHEQGAPERIENREEVERLMLRLDPKEADIVRMYHLEGKSYKEISQQVGLAENSIGPVLSRARAKMREGA